MIYLSSVYSKYAEGNDAHSRATREKRAQYAMRRAGEFITKGYKIFSPIAHCHQMSNLLDMPKDFAFWQRIDHHYIDISDAVWVLMMPHWEESMGVQDEIQYAKLTGKPVIYVDCKDYEEHKTS